MVQTLFAHETGVCPRGHRYSFDEPDREIETCKAFGVIKDKVHRNE